jgi:hypothetical protein
MESRSSRTKPTKKEKDKFLLPDTSNPCYDDPFATVWAGWSEQGLRFEIDVNSPVKKIAPLNVSDGDSIELFIDTRDVKSGGFNTRFCHHFFFLPESVEGVQAGEITRFRTEDSHPLCDPKDLKIKTSQTSSGYQAEIFIPTQCLCSYDPLEFNRLGFTYRINRANQPAQHFSVVSDDYQIDQNPSCWGTLRLAR